MFREENPSLWIRGKLQSIGNNSDKRRIVTAAGAFRFGFRTEVFCIYLSPNILYISCSQTARTSVGL